MSSTRWVGESIRVTSPVLGLQEQLHQPRAQEITLAGDTDDGRTEIDLANQREAFPAVRVAHTKQQLSSGTSDVRALLVMLAQRFLCSACKRSTSQKTRLAGDTDVDTVDCHSPADAIVLASRASLEYQAKQSTLQVPTWTRKYKKKASGGRTPACRRQTQITHERNHAELPMRLGVESNEGSGNFSFAREAETRRSEAPFLETFVSEELEHSDRTGQL